MLEVKIDNHKEINEALKNMDKKLQRKFLYQSNRQAANVAAKILRQNAPEDKDSTRKKYNAKPLKRLVVVQKKKRSRNGTGVLVGFHPDAFRVRFLEWGTKIRQTKKGANRGQMQPRPFVQRSHHQAAPIMMRMLTKDYQKTLTKVVEREVKRLDRKIKKMS